MVCRCPEGYPDNGSGQFSQKLPLEDWISFNNGQRAHYNFLEQFGSTIVLLLISGLFYTRLAVIAGLMFIVGRVCYSIGYRQGGPKGRMVGAGLCDLALILTFGAAAWGSFMFAGGINGLKAVF